MGIEFLRSARAGKMHRFHATRWVVFLRVSIHAKQTVTSLNLQRLLELRPALVSGLADIEQSTQMVDTDLVSAEKTRAGLG
jgi:hypothetical protein